MNYLAHAFLSGNNTNWLVGNFIADHVRGNHFETYPPGIVEGIYLHRRIDAFTDAHPEFKKSKRVFYNGFEKYSGILVDIYFDHFLARDFSRYSKTPLASFSAEVYKTYSSHLHILPQSSAGFLEYVIKNNIYISYGHIEGMEQVLSHLSHRIRHQVRLDASIPLFKQHETELQSCFEIFFKDAMREFGLTEI